MTSCFRVRMRRKVRSFWGSMSRTTLRALAVSWCISPAYCTVVELSSVVLTGIPVKKKNRSGMSSLSLRGQCCFCFAKGTFSIFHLQYNKLLKGLLGEEKGNRGNGLGVLAVQVLRISNTCEGSKSRHFNGSKCLNMFETFSCYSSLASNNLYLWQETLKNPPTSMFSNFFIQLSGTFCVPCAFAVVLCKIPVQIYIIRSLFFRSFRRKKNNKFVLK